MADKPNSSWEEEVVDQIDRSIDSSFGLIDDPDNIASERVLADIIDKGWKVTSVTNQFELRFEYENQVRQDQSIKPEQFLFILRFPYSNVPYDISEDADVLHLSLKLFFPNLSYNILRNLPISWRSTIFNNQAEISGEQKPLDDIGTAQFILRECLGLDYAPNPTFVDILSLLADIALHKLEIPTSLKSVLLSQPRDRSVLQLFDYMDTPEKAVQFLQEVWQQYFQYKLSKNLTIAEGFRNEVAESVLYLDKNREFQTKVTALVAENILRPLEISADASLPDWMNFGIHYYHDKIAALREKLEHLTNIFPGKQAGFNEWTEFAFQWAAWKLEYLQVSQVPSDLRNSLAKCINQLDENYSFWLEHHYPSLVMQPYLPSPTCVHHVLNHISSTFKPSPSHPVALLVVDGMAIQDWLLIQSEILNANLTWQIQVYGVLALVPTLTSVSRQALLSGMMPRYFAQNWLDTNSEEILWRSFWQEQGLHPQSIGFVKGLGSKKNIDTSGLVLEDSISGVLDRPHLSVAAFIVNTIDELVHTSVFGERDFYHRIKHLTQNRRLFRLLISRMLERFDAVIVASDHGHIAGKGIGDLSLSSVAEERAYRARVFKGHVFEKQAGENPEIALWQNTVLPLDATVIIPKGRGLFAKEGYSGISHGGASLEETIVPYIMITR